MIIIAFLSSFFRRRRKNERQTFHCAGAAQNLSVLYNVYIWLDFLLFVFACNVFALHFPGLNAPLHTPPSYLYQSSVITCLNCSKKVKKKRFNKNKVKESDFYCCRLFKGAIRNVHLSLETEINRCKKLYLSYSYITSLSKLIKKNYWFICGGTSWTKVIQVFDCSISSGKEKEIALPLPVTIVINSTFKPAQRFNNILF